MQKHIYNELDVPNLKNLDLNLIKYQFHYSVGAISLDQQRSEDFFRTLELNEAYQDF